MRRCPVSLHCSVVMSDAPFRTALTAGDMHIFQQRRSYLVLLFSTRTSFGRCDFSPRIGDSICARSMANNCLIQAVLERISPGFHHKQYLVRIGVMNVFVRLLDERSVPYSRSTARKFLILRLQEPARQPSHVWFTQN